MKESLHTLAYAGILGIVCALLLTGAGWFAAPYRHANEEADRVRNILGVLGVPFQEGAPSQELVAAYGLNVNEEERGELTLYFYADREAEGGFRAVAAPFAGQGLWGPIRGFLALEPDMRTIRAVTFYDQEETPGLGGEIGSAWFQDQFKGKSIEDAEGNPGLRIVGGGGASAQNEVDAITGATMTCGKVEEMLNATIALIGEETGADGQ